MTFNEIDAWPPQHFRCDQKKLDETKVNELYTINYISLKSPLFTNVRAKQFALRGEQRMKCRYIDTRAAALQCQE